MGWRRRLGNSGPRQDQVEQHLADEVTFHRDQYAPELQAEGWSAEQARQEATRRVGLPNAWVAAGPAEDTWTWVTTWWHEATLLGVLAMPVAWAMATVTAL